jgi:hypothetical protein
MSKIEDILAVMARQGNASAPTLDEIQFGVCVDDAGGAAVCELGEVYLVRERDADERAAGMGREFGGEWRRPWKWSGAYEVFDTLEQAQARAREVTA